MVAGELSIERSDRLIDISHCEDELIQFTLSSIVKEGGSSINFTVHHIILPISYIKNRGQCLN